MSSTHDSDSAPKAPHVGNADSRAVTESAKHAKPTIFISRSSTADRWPVANLKRFENTVVSYYRKHGFPFYSLSTSDKHKEFKKTNTYDHTQLISDGGVKQVMHGCALASSYHPHMWSIRCGKMRTPREVFNDDRLFRKAVAKRLKYGSNISDSAIRKALRTFSGTQSVSNFRPLAAAAIYHRFLPATGGTVFDPSCGFGGRLLGSMVCPKVTRYVGCDPSTKTFMGLTRMRNDLLPLLNRPMQVELHRIGSEDFRPVPESIDLCFTSPPYWGHEQYARERTQSFIKYPTREEWLNGYMRMTLENCRFGLKDSGYLVINIAGVRSYPDLHTDFLRLAKDCGFRHTQTLGLKLSKMMGTRQRGEKHKHEPVFVFKKGVR